MINPGIADDDPAADFDAPVNTVYRPFAKATAKG